MPEIKNSFFQGKMNKDLDERLVPNGQYRDALNIEVSTSEGDDVGTVQSVKGNTLVSGDVVPTDSSIVGEIIEEKNNCIYYFVAGPKTTRSNFDASDTQPTISKDLILKYDGTSITNVFTDVYSYLAVFDTSSTDLSYDITAQTITLPNTDTYKQSLVTNMYVNVFDTSGVEYVRNNRILTVSGAVITLENKIDDLDGVAIANLILEITHKDNKRPLNFEPAYPVTGINIVDDFLMWTDNNSEPKKISISRSTAGTLTGDEGRRKSTKLYIDGEFDVNGNLVNNSYPITTGKRADESHTTIARKSPLNSPDINIKEQRTKADGSSITNVTTRTLNMASIVSGDFIEIDVSDPSTGFGKNPFLVNDVIHLKAGSTPTATDFDVRVKVVSLVDNKIFKAKVLSAAGGLGSSVFNTFLFEEENDLFKDKFSFFATRFKYIDGEYSTFSPFSNSAFLPSAFSYDTEKAFNAGMVNKIKEIELTNIIPEDIPEDVVQVDILYTESNSPEIYKVDSVRKDSTIDFNWKKNKYVISKENIYSLLEEKQLLRQWDNVPKKALAQEIVGNRIVYANYEQGYDLENQNVDLEAYVDDRVFTGPELLPNRHLTSHFDSYLTSPSTSTSFTHAKGINDKTAGHIDVDAISNAFHKLHTSVDLNLESGAEYYYSFKISNWSGTGVLEGPALMSGDHLTGKYGDFAKQITGDGNYYGTMTINLDRNGTSVFGNDPAIVGIRDFMFQIKTLGFTCDISHFSLKKVITNNKESVKSIRNYKLGVVYADEYGRETPVLTSKTASLSVPKANAKSINCIKSTIKSDPPTWATHFKYFVKETSSDYNNIALDRIYKSGEGGYWLSFPSSERNKIDEDDFLILKKSHDDTVAVDDAEAIYKVLDISNNAPDFVKTNRNSVGEGGSAADINNDLFENASTRPLTGSNTISFNKDSWITTEANNNLSELIKTKDLVFKFKNNVNQVSETYAVDSIEIVDFSGSDHYQIKMENPFVDADVGENGFVMASGLTTIETNVKIEFFTSKIENKPEFDGRFFVKVNSDAFITSNVYENSTNELSAVVVANTPSFYKQDAVAYKLKTDYSNATQITNSLWNGYATMNADPTTNLVSINDLESVSAWNDLTHTDFKDNYDPFPNLSFNDTIYYEARPWFESGDARSGVANQEAGDGKNLYKVNTRGLQSATLHLNFNSGYTALAQDQIGNVGVGNADNIVGVDQSTQLVDATAAGLLKHAAYSYSYGLFQSQDTSGTNRNYSIYGSVGAYMKFLRLFKYGVAGADDDLGLTGSYGSGWFIDNTSFIGIQKDTSYNPETDGIYLPYHRAVHYELHTGNVLEKGKADGTNSTANAMNDYERVARGIYEAEDYDEDADQNIFGTLFHEEHGFYMQLSYGGFEDDISHSIFNASDLSSLENELQNKGWRSNSAEFQNMVNSIKIGAKFKFVQDTSNEEYEILDFKIVKRYNHTPFPGNSNVYYQYFDDSTGLENVTFGNLRDTNSTKKFRARENHDITSGNGNFDLITIGTSGTIVQDSIADEEKRFLRGSNRRLTYILKLDKLPGSNATFYPVNETGTNDATLMDGNSSKIIQFTGDIVEEGTQLTTDNPAVFETEPKTTEGLDIYYEASDFYDIKDHGVTQDLKYFNCYSFENGVESNRIKDVFNKNNVGKGIVASSTLDEVYKKDNRVSGLIFSGIYNSTSNVNNLNQFIQAEKITKDVNPTYGSIQKLHTKDSNLLVLCEDKVLKILANKDAVFNADGNPQLTANKNVLGQTIPYAGEFGISKDPTSFASQSHRAYFTDKQRGAVLRLSMDGLTSISQYGMADFFKDELPSSTALIGSYDTRKNEYNIKIDGTTDYIVSFNENIKGWSSFKSFTAMQAGASFNNNYYTFNDGELYKHHSNEARCNFYGAVTQPYVEVILNTNPYENKRFKNVIYEGTQGKIDLLDVTSDGSDADVYNINAKTGWFAETIITPTQSGSINEFLEKDNKWYNYIKGDAITASNIDTSDFNVQGLGIITSNTAS